MKKFKEVYGEQVIYEGATVEDFYSLQESLESVYGALSVKEGDRYLDFYVEGWGVVLSLVKATGMLHCPYKYLTWVMDGRESDAVLVDGTKVWRTGM